MVPIAALIAAGAVAAPAQGHGIARGGPDRPGEQQLRAFESGTLGADHAAEHARQRAVARDPAQRARRRRAERAARAAGVRARASAAPDVDGAWVAPFDIPTLAIHAALLPTGKVLWFGRRTTDDGPFLASVWDPTTGRNTRVDPPRGPDGKPLNIFCSGQSFLADGRLLVTGGNLEDPTGWDPRYKGLDTVLTFNPFDETWTRQPSMEHGRWYPSQVLLPDGRTVIVDGLDESGKAGPHNDDIEVFTPSPDLNGVGTITTLDGRRGTTGAPPVGELYPHLLLMPSGRTLVAGPSRQDSWLLNPFGAGRSYTWADVPDPAVEHYYGGGVILPSDTPGSTRVELVGGANPRDGEISASARNERFDEARASAGWTDAAPLAVARAHHNTVLLPDGSMVAVGGGRGEVDGDLSRFDDDHRSIDLFDPATGLWRRGPAQVEGRAYHSTALLLPDGRVISAGDDTNGGGRARDTAEIYSPSYLFQGARPTITAAPDALPYAGEFDVAHGATDVARAVLVAPGATTHANDMNQRYVPLPMTGRGPGTVRLASPSGPTIAPPGWYMLFLVDAEGVPSVARFVRVGSSPVGPVPGDQGASGAPTGAGPAIPPTGGPPPPVARPVTPTDPGALLTPGALGRQALRTVLSRGLRVPFACRRGCGLRAELTLDPASARRLRITRRRATRPVVVGRGSVRFTEGARRGTVRVRLTSTARRRLRSARRVTLRLTLTAIEAGGRRQTATRRLTLRR